MFKQALGILLVFSAYLLVCALGYLGWLTSPTNLVGWFLILTALAYGLSGPYLLWSNLRKVKLLRAEQADCSFWLILPGFLVVFYASPVEYLYLPGIIPGARATGMQIVGLVLIALSIVLFTWARLALRGLYSGRLRVTADHALVQHGPYHVIRHPAYASYIIMCVGIAIGFSSLIGLVAVPLLLVPGFIYRIAVEDSLLKAEFGEQYHRYAQHTKRLIPYVW